MARTTPRAKNVQVLDSLTLPHGLEATEFRAQKPEDEQERTPRSRKDFLSFLIKDLLAYGIVLVLASALYGFWVLLRTEASQEDRRFAMSIVTSILTAVAGFAFGKASR